MWDDVINKHGGIHILVNNAAITRCKSFKKMDYNQFKTTLDINFMTYVHLSKLFLE